MSGKYEQISSGSENHYVAKRTTELTEEQLEKYRRKGIQAMWDNDLHLFSKYWSHVLHDYRYRQIKKDAAYQARKYGKRYGKRAAEYFSQIKSEQTLDDTAGKGQEMKGLKHQVKLYSISLTFVKAYAKGSDSLLRIPCTGGKRPSSDGRFGFSNILRLFPGLGPTLCLLFSLFVYVYIPWRVGMPCRLWMSLIWGIIEHWAISLFPILGPIATWTRKSDTQASAKVEEWLELCTVIAKHGTHQDANGNIVNQRLGEIFNDKDPGSNVYRPLTYPSKFRESVVEHSCCFTNGCCA